MFIVSPVRHVRRRLAYEPGESCARYPRWAGVARSRACSRSPGQSGVQDCDRTRRKGVLEGLASRLHRTLAHPDRLMVEGVDRSITLSCYLESRHLLFESRAGELDGGFDLAFRVAVYDDEDQVLAGCIAGRRDVEQVERSQIGDPVRPGGSFSDQIVGLAFHVGVEYDLAHVLGAEPQGMVDRLEEEPFFVREDRGYHVDHLGEVGDLDDLAVAGEDVEVGGDSQCVGEVVAFLQSRGLLALAEPHVPLVVGDVDGMSDALLQTSAFDHGADRTKGAVRLVWGEHVRPVVVASRVYVDAVVVDERRQALDHHPVPVCQATQATAHKLYARVRPLHDLGELAGLLYVVIGFEGPDLPLPVYLVAKGPVPDVVRLLVTVLAPEVRPVGVALAVAVLYPGLGLVHGARAHVDADVGLGPEQATVLDKLVRAEAIGFFGGPREIHLPRPLLARTDPVGPVVAADEVPTGPAQDWYPQVFRCFENVAPVASFVAQGRAFVEDATVDAAAKVLDKSPEYPSVQLADPSVRIDLDPGQPLLLSRFAKALGSLRKFSSFSALQFVSFQQEHLQVLACSSRYSIERFRAGRNLTYPGEVHFGFAVVGEEAVDLLFDVGELGVAETLHRLASKQSVYEGPVAFEELLRVGDGAVAPAFGIFSGKGYAAELGDEDGFAPVGIAWDVDGLVRRLGGDG